MVIFRIGVVYCFPAREIFDSAMLYSAEAFFCIAGEIKKAAIKLLTVAPSSTSMLKFDASRLPSGSGLGDLVFLILPACRATPFARVCGTTGRTPGAATF